MPQNSGRHRVPISNRYAPIAKPDLLLGTHNVQDSLASVENGEIIFSRKATSAPPTAGQVVLIHGIVC